MSNASCYRVIYGSFADPVPFQSLISDHMREGWVPIGGVSVNQGSLLQAMCRPMFDVTAITDDPMRWVPA